MLEPKWIFDKDGLFLRIEWEEPAASLRLTERLERSESVDSFEDSLPKAS